MKVYIEERAVELAQFIIDKKTTVRAAAKKFGISKSTVHKDVYKWSVHMNFSSMLVEGGKSI